MMNKRNEEISNEFNKRNEEMSNEFNKRNEEVQGMCGRSDMNMINE